MKCGLQMPAAGLGRSLGGRMHYAWVVLAVMFSATLAGVGVRAAPGVMIVPLEHAFGWSVATISAAVSINIILMGATGPFLTGLIEFAGLKRTILGCMLTLVAGTALSNLMTAPWQLFLTWGVLVGIGSGAGAVGMAAAVTNRWFARRAGLAMGLLTAANAAGQLIFLPLLAMLAERYGWRGVSLTVTLAIAAMVPLVALLMPEWPADAGTHAYGTEGAPPGPPRPHGNPFAVPLATLARAAHSPDFWLLTGSFAVCGLSTNGLINTHLIAYCADHGISQVAGADILAALGVFSLIGATLSGWMCDRFNPRLLLFWYYGLRGLSLIVVPFTQFDAVSLSIFAVFYGLDWVATGPATFALANEVFGRRDTPVIVAWIFAGHQIGGAVAAFGAGAVRSLTGDYMLAFMTSGLACLLASLLVLRITRPLPATAAAA
jgi:MFS family permease